MLFRSIRFFFLIFSLAFSSSLLAQDNYQQWVDDITARLDKTSQLIQQGNTDDARTEGQISPHKKATKWKQLLAKSVK